MPNKHNHLVTAKENHSLACSLADSETSLAWSTTIAFYSALHLVEAAFANEGLHFDNHTARNLYLKKTRRLQNIWRHYKPLYDASLKARYLMDDSGSAESLIRSYLGIDGVREKVLGHHLRQVEKSVSKLLKVDCIFGSTD